MRLCDCRSCRFLRKRNGHDVTNRPRWRGLLTIGARNSPFLGIRSVALQIWCLHGDTMMQVGRWESHPLILEDVSPSAGSVSSPSPPISIFSLSSLLFLTLHSWWDYAEGLFCILTFFLGLPFVWSFPLSCISLSIFLLLLLLVDLRSYNGLLGVGNFPHTFYCNDVWDAGRLWHCNFLFFKVSHLHPPFPKYLQMFHHRRRSLDGTGYRMWCWDQGLCNISSHPIRVVQIQWNLSLHTKQSRYATRVC